ncbi:tryptophan halogenase family protein [Fulvimonas soli]|jgi:tryptophan halogenase|uniref:Tryptophan halogenase n=1 Tax=Fulvimonas soli TaxID=155197 RepID=A0A316HW68_9GAMM|nr:tryptophan halogenase family protein [Fulvimonas soli]PWK84701.1 tryptophan halogenase [Fulvimonas soli]TNY26995.1 tryptophan halogenase [Fulvimonas soli]
MGNQTNELPVRRVVIVGGGTAGWMTAALLAKAFGPRLSIRLVESDEIGIVGVGEATIPQIRHVGRFLGIAEDELLRASRGTIKLAVQFNDWRRIGDSYVHAFSDVGLPLGLAAFQHYWLRSRREDPRAPDLWAYSICARACAANRFAPMENVGGSPLTGIRYAYHFDAARFGRLLRRNAEGNGVVRTEGKVVDVALRGDDGFIESIRLHSGEVIPGDLFVDCSGFRGLLIEGALKTGYESWQHWLPCDSAVVAPSEHGGTIRPYTQASAQQAGWQWRIPLQHLASNGHVYCSRFVSDDEAAATLVRNMEGPALAAPRQLRFHTGIRNKVWNRNCVALGLASGFIEPLESTSIHLMQSAAGRLLTMFPDRGFDPALVDEYNRQTRAEYEQTRDFIILHYKATERDDTPFWRRCATMDVPEGLARRIGLFRRTGHVFREGEELFTLMGWLQVFIGQGIVPERHHPLADALPKAQLDEFLANIRTLVDRAVAAMPTHAEYIDRHFKAAD